MSKNTKKSPVDSNEIKVKHHQLPETDKSIEGKNNGIESHPFKHPEHQTSDDILKIASNYKRIGTEYYLYSDILTAKKEQVKVLKKWKKTFIKDDHGLKVLEKIEKYFDFVLVPDNSIGYKRDVGGCYNVYEPIGHKPTLGQFSNTQDFLAHIFGDHLELGLDYLTLLYRKPAEKLPALCLVSKEQKTGKTTLLRWLCKIFGDNAVILGNEDFGSNFNTSWSSKLIIGIDESFIDKRIVKEKIKRLVTDDTILAEHKGVDKVRRNFIGKFILLSNNEHNFIQMEKEDSRFFVLKIPTVDIEDPNLEDKLIKEIPAFLYFLNNRELRHKKESRLWFKPEDYETEALKRIVKSSKHFIEKATIEYLTDLMNNITASKEFEKESDIKIVPVRIAEAIKPIIGFYKGLHLQIGDILRSWNLQPSEKSERFKFPIFDEKYNEISQELERVLKYVAQTGTYYTIPFSLIEHLNK